MQFRSGLQANHLFWGMDMQILFSVNYDINSSSSGNQLETNVYTSFNCPIVDLQNYIVLVYEINFVRGKSFVDYCCWQYIVWDKDLVLSDWLYGLHHLNNVPLYTTELKCCVFRKYCTWLLFLLLNSLSPYSVDGYYVT